MATNIKNFSKNLEVVRTKFSNKELKKLLDLAVLINWKQNPQQICIPPHIKANSTGILWKPTTAAMCGW